MKSFYFLVIISAWYLGVQADANTTVTCTVCPPASSTPDIVTRSDIPSTSCTAPALTAVYNTSMTMAQTMTGSTPSPTAVVTSGGSKGAAPMAALLLMVAAVLYTT